MKVYKVLLARLKDKEDASSMYYSSAFTPSDYLVEYGFNMVTYPILPSSLLYAFKTLQAAIDYVGDPKETILSKDAVLKVFECEAEVVDLPPAVTHCMESIENFWSDHWYALEVGYPYVELLNDDTVLCKWIELKRDVFSDGRVLKAQKPTPKRTNYYGKSLHMERK